MADDARVRPDRFVVVACASGALLMAALTLGAADAMAARTGVVAIALFVAMGLAPYVLTAALSAIRSRRRLVVAATRAVAIVFGVFDCGLRYLALYHPTGSTDALVVVALPFWWLPIALAVTAVTATTLWVVSRRTGRPAFN